MQLLQLLLLLELGQRHLSHSSAVGAATQQRGRQAQASSAQRSRPVTAAVRDCGLTENSGEFVRSHSKQIDVAVAEIVLRSTDREKG